MRDLSLSFSWLEDALNAVCQKKINESNEPRMALDDRRYLPDKLMHIHRELKMGTNVLPLNVTVK